MVVMHGVAKDAVACTEKDCFYTGSSESDTPGCSLVRQVMQCIQSWGGSGLLHETNLDVSIRPAV